MLYLVSFGRKSERKEERDRETVRDGSLFCSVLSRRLHDSWWLSQLLYLLMAFPCIICVRKREREEKQPSTLLTITNGELLSRHSVRVVCSYVLNAIEQTTSTFVYPCNVHFFFLSLTLARAPFSPVCLSLYLFSCERLTRVLIYSTWPF